MIDIVLGVILTLCCIAFVVSASLWFHSMITDDCPKVEEKSDG